MDVFLDVLCLHLRMTWCCGVFNGLGLVRWLHACVHFTWAYFIHPTASKSSSMFALSLSRSLSHHDLSVYTFLQFTHDGMTLNLKYPSLRWCIVFHDLGPGKMTGWEEGPVTMHCAVLGDREGDWSLRLCKAQLRLRWGTLGHNLHCQGKLHIGHWETGLHHWGNQWQLQGGTLRGTSA